MQEMHVCSLGWKDALQREMATHSSILAWGIPWARSLAGPTATVRSDSVTKTKQQHTVYNCLLLNFHYKDHKELRILIHVIKTTRNKGNNCMQGK